VPGSLFDTSVWVASFFSTHPSHSLASEALLACTAEAPAVFCRATQQSFLRLVTTPTVLKMYGAEGLSNRDALVALTALVALPQVIERDEPPGTVPLWHRLASSKFAAPKVWMDAYLASFAISSELRLTSLDQDFKNFKSHGLAFDNLTQLKPRQSRSVRQQFTARTLGPSQASPP
jgi:uncharacterized protein